MKKLSDFKRSKILYVRIRQYDEDASNMMIFNLSDKDFTIDRIDDTRAGYLIDYNHDSLIRPIGQSSLEQYDYLIPFIGKMFR